MVVMVVMDGVGPTAVAVLPQVSLGDGAAPLGAAVDPTTGPVVAVADTALIDRGVTSGSVSSDRTRRLAPATQHDLYCLLAENPVKDRRGIFALY